MADWVILRPDLCSMQYMRVLIYGPWLQDPATSIYNMQYHLDCSQAAFPGSVDHVLLGAGHEAIARQNILRTVFKPAKS